MICDILYAIGLWYIAHNVLFIITGVNKVLPYNGGALYTPVRGYVHHTLLIWVFPVTAVHVLLSPKNL